MDVQDLKQFQGIEEYNTDNEIKDLEKKQMVFMSGTGY